MGQLKIEQREIVESLLKSDEISAESQGRIGTGTPGRESRITLKVHAPLNAQITRIKGYLRNAAWPDGCDLGSSHWVEADLINYHEPIGWAYAGHLTRGTTPTSQWVSATFVNWSHCNARYGRLQVFYKFPGSKVEEIKTTEVDPELQGPIWKG
ncbi:MAG: hypothetical protein ACNYWU_09995 [Desulfobacterales bacterium]